MMAILRRVVAICVKQQSYSGHLGSNCPPKTGLRSCCYPTHRYMGKGGGCFASKEDNQPEVTAKPAAPPATPPLQVKAQSTNTMPDKDTVKIYVVFYSMYGHVYKLAQKEKEGVDSVPGCEGILFQVPETLPEGVLAKMHAPPKPDVPILDVHELPKADGFIFGFPTRYGGMPGQFKAFWDATGGLWQSGALVGKPFGLFTSTASQGGGQESTMMSSLGNFVHHGMTYIAPGYSYGPALFSNSEVHGGSAWGAGTFANADGSRQPSEVELGNAKHQGKFTAEIIVKLAAK